MIKKWYIELHIEERLERKLCVSKVELQVEGLFDGWLLKLYNIIMNVKEWMEIYQIKRSFRYLFDSSPQGHVLIHLMCIYAMVTPSTFIVVVHLMDKALTWVCWARFHITYVSSCHIYKLSIICKLWVSILPLCLLLFIISSRQSEYPLFRLLKIGPLTYF